MKRNIYLLSILFLLIFTGLMNAQKSLNLYKIPAGANITLDGLNDDIWSTCDGFDEDQKNLMYHTKEDNDVLITPDDQFDLDVTWNGAYNDTALFFFFNVVDDEVQQPGPEKESWYHDKIEAYFQVGNGSLDNENSDVGNNCQDGYYQYDFPIVYYPEKTWGLNETCLELQNGKANWRTQITDDGYTMEFYVLFDGLRNERDEIFVPGGDAFMLFEPHVHDNDNMDLDEVNPRCRSYWSLDGQEGSLTGGHAWEHGAWETGNIGIIVFSDTELSCTSGISNKTRESNMWTYPNPVKSHLFFKQEVSSVKISNVLGVEIKTLQVSGLNKVSLSDIQPGVYMISLYRNGTYLSTSKIIKR